MSELGFDMIPGCLAVCATGALIGLGISLLIDSYILKPHCIKCDKVVYDVKYCPNCGTSTDSVNMHNYWDTHKEN